MLVHVPNWPIWFNAIDGLWHYVERAREAACISAMFPEGFHAGGPNTNVVAVGRRFESEILLVRVQNGNSGLS